MSMECLACRRGFCDWHQISLLRVVSSAEMFPQQTHNIAGRSNSPQMPEAEAASVTILWLLIHGETLAFISGANLPEPSYNRTMPAEKTVHTVCSHDCPDSCGVLVTVDETGRATRIQGDPAHPVTRGFLCGKVAKYLDRVYSPDRLLYPMGRRSGVPKGPLPFGRERDAFERISWDEALDTIAKKLQQISDEYGPEAILPYSYAGTIGVLGYGSMDRRFFH